ncbi:sensor histidine kinase [Serinibacter salmoneus]|uniref:Signal transduction histidine kinase n=1 Tax=Serinibacter salmoneus TaxID=556530 RepID=A0A2A9CWF7_9MICO|nr:ATP-binding protein [Serinibacter salmoneus]PFG18768.1 signal transduction histidine kinase [Serinibacter salmoneus]
MPIEGLRVEVAARKTVSVFLGAVSGAWLIVAISLPVSGLATIAAVTYTAVAQVFVPVAFRRRPPLWLTMTTIAVGTASFLLAVSGPGNMPRDVAALLMVSLMFLTVVMLRRSPGLSVMTLLVLVAASVIAAIPHGPTAEAVQLILPPMAATAGLAIALPGMEAADLRVERARREVAQASLETAAQRAKLTAHRAVQRTLHDAVLPALRHVASLAVSRTDARDEARRALLRLQDVEHQAAELDQEDPTCSGDVPTSSLTRALDAVQRGIPGITVHGPEVALGPELPAEVTHALAGAVAEAIRNVERHAGVTQATVTVTKEPERVVVRVVDHGCGFDPSRTRESFGMRHSVRERLAEVGGEVSVTSTPGQGTAVVLSWQFSDWRKAREGSAATRAHCLTSSLTDPRWGAAGVLLPLALLAIGHGIVAVLLLGQSWYWLVWAAGLLAFGGITIWRGEQRADLGVHVALQAVAALGLLAFVTTSGPDDIIGPLAWPISLAALAPGISAALRSGVLAPVAAGAMCLGVMIPMIIGAGHEGDPALLIRSLPSILSTLWPAALGTILRHILLSMGAERDREQAQLAAEQARESAAARHTADVRARTRHIHRLLDPTLGAIARGDLDLSDPSVLEEADVLERTIRYELHLPFGLTPKLAQAIRDARLAGSEVVLATTSDLLRAPPAATELLQAALTGDTLPQRVTLSVSAAGDTVTLVAQAGRERDLERMVAALSAHSGDVRAVADTVIARA